MEHPLLKVLILEDNPYDAELNLTTLKQDGWNFEHRLTSDEEGFRRELHDFDPDIILSDYNLPTINGLEALEICMDLKPLTPFIMVTGSLDEETAVQCIKKGAWDYVLKEQLLRLNTAVRYALQYKKEMEQRKEAEQRIVESEEHYRVLSQNSPDIIMRFDKECRHLFVNNSIKRQLDLNPEIFINKTHEEMGIFPENLCRFWEDNIKKVFETGKPIEVEFCLEKPRHAEVEWRLFPEYNKEGQISTVLALARDITDKKAASRKLHESETMLKLVLDNIPQAIFWKDLDSKYLGANRTFLNDASVNGENEIIGKTDYDLPWSREESDYFLEWDRKVMERDQPAQHIVESRRLADETVSWYNTNKVPLHDENGGVIGVLGTAENITEKREAQNALKASEERLKMALEASEDGLWDWNTRTSEFYFSPRYFTMLGYEPTEFKHDISVYLELIHPDDKEEVEEYLKEALSAKSDVVEMEMRLRKKNGSYAWILSRGKVFKKEKDGSAVRIVGTHVDISERKRHEEIQSVLFEIANSVISTRNLNELFESIQLSLNRVVDTKNCYIALYDENNDTISLPFHRDEIDEFNEFPAGKTITAYVIKTGTSQLVNLDRVEELEEAGIIEPIGAPSISWLGVPLKIAGKIIGVFVVQSYDESIIFTPDDVQILEFVSDQIALAIERKMDQDNIKANQERQRKIFESTPDGLVIIDTQGEVQDYNTSFSDMLRIAPEKLKSRNFFEFLFDEDILRVQNILHDTQASGYQKNIEFRMRRDNNSDFYAETSFGVIHSAEGKEDNFLIIVKNIDERKVYETNLRIAKEKAEESDRLKTAFLSNMSHEIRTPMNAIIGFAELLATKGLTNPERDEFIQQINYGADSLMRLIDDIIDISKIEAGQIKINPSIFDISGTLSDLSMMFNKTLKRINNHDIRLIEDHNGFNHSVQVHADEFRLRQVFSNLVNNAFKFTEKGEVRYGIKGIANGFLQLYVRDTGIGIAPEQQKVIFDRFRQGHENKTRFYGGTGLGLAISKHLVELMGGSISVLSEPGKGSEFVFTVPTFNMDIHIPDEKIKINRGINDFSNRVFLVAEDDDSNYILLSEILKPTKVSLIRARDGFQVVELFKRNPGVDLILMDVQLPLQNGYDATREIKKISGKVPVIAQTAYAMAGERKKSMKAGCDDYIAKPIKIRELMFLLNKYLM